MPIVADIRSAIILLINIPQRTAINIIINLKMAFLVLKLMD